MLDPQSTQNHRSLARTVWLILAAGFGMLGLLILVYELRLALTWTSIALLIALATQPPVAWLTRRRVSRGLAVAIVYIVLFAVVALLFGTAIPMVIEQASALIRAAPDVLDRLEHFAPFEWADRRFAIVDALENALRQRASRAPAAAVDVLQAIVGGITIIVLSIFMLLFGEDVFRSALAWVHPSRRPHWQELAARMRRVVGRFVVGSFLVSSIGGLVIGLSLVMVGNPYFLALGLLMVLFGLVPFIGSFVGAVLVVGVTLATEGVRDALIVLGIYLVYQQIEGNVLQPLVQRRTLRMNPLIVALAVLAGTTLAGIFGAIIALPVAGMIQVLLSDRLAARTATYEA